MGEADQQTPEPLSTSLSIARGEVPSTSPGVPLVSVEGELDSLSSEELLAVVREMLHDADPADRPREPRPADPSRPPLLVIDVDGVTFCDSRGLGVLVTSVATARRAGRSLRIVCGAERTVSRLTRRVGLAGLLPMFTNAADAVAAATGSALEDEIAATPPAGPAEQPEP